MQKPFKRIAVTGGRDYKNQSVIDAVLDQYLGHIEVLIHGKCPTGADALAAYWAKRRGIREIPFPADWRSLGHAAGPTRNQRMVDAGRPDLVIAFPGAHGTADMVGRSRAANIPILEIEY